MVISQICYQYLDLYYRFLLLVNNSGISVIFFFISFNAIALRKAKIEYSYKIEYNFGLSDAVGLKITQPNLEWFDN